MCTVSIEEYSPGEGWYGVATVEYDCRATAENELELSGWSQIGHIVYMRISNARVQTACITEEVTK